MLLPTLLASSRPIRSVTFGTPYRYDSAFPIRQVLADTWYNTWADDDEIYSIACDWFGWDASNGTIGRNWSLNRLSTFGNDTVGTVINTMDAYGVNGASGTDGAMYKACGLISIGGTLYATVARQVYGSDASDYVQFSSDAQIIKSIDHGETWTPSPPGTAQPFAAPTWPGTRFSSPSFVMYGKDYQGNRRHNSDRYVYAMSPDGVWNNGNSLVIGRCLISDMPNLDGADWSYYQGGNGTLDSAWGSIETAELIVHKTNGVGQVSVHFLPAFNRYVMFEWSYPGIPDGVTTSGVTPVVGHSIWDIYDGEAPWGPWKLIQTTDWPTEGFYNPTVIQKSLITDGGRNVRLATTGDFSQYADPEGPYTLTLMDARFN
jgi:hypothetical protein